MKRMLSSLSHLVAMMKIGFSGCQCSWRVLIQRHTAELQKVIKLQQQLCGYHEIQCFKKNADTERAPVAEEENEEEHSKSSKEHIMIMLEANDDLSDTPSMECIDSNAEQKLLDFFKPKTKSKPKAKKEYKLFKLFDEHENRNQIKFYDSDEKFDDDDDFIGPKDCDDASIDSEELSIPDLMEPVTSDSDDDTDNDTMEVCNVADEKEHHRWCHACPKSSHSKMKCLMDNFCDDSKNDQDIT